MPNRSQAPKIIVSEGYACIALWEGNGEFSVVLMNESKIFASGLSCIYNQCNVYRLSYCVLWEQYIWIVLLGLV